MANDEIADRDGGGSSTDDASLTSIDFGAFLTDSSSLKGVDFRSASGINVFRVAQAAIGAIVFAWAWGVNALIAAVSESYARLVDGIGDFIGTGLIEATLGVGITAIEGVWTFAFSEFGVLSYPVALVTVLATLYVAERGITTAQEVLR